MEELMPRLGRQKELMIQGGIPSGRVRSCLQLIRSSFTRLRSCPNPVKSGIRPSGSDKSRKSGRTFWERFHVAGVQAELGQGGDVAEDGVGPLILGQCVAVAHVEVLQGWQLSEPFGEASNQQ